MVSTGVPHWVRRRPQVHQITDREVFFPLTVSYPPGVHRRVASIPQGTIPYGRFMPRSHDRPCRQRGQPGLLDVSACLTDHPWGRGS